MSSPLNFGSSGNPFDDTKLSGYDAPGAPGPDLSGFDTADGTTTVPAGVYTLKVERGELTTTKAGKTAYRLCFKTVEPSAHAGFVLWRWYVLADAAGMNRAKAALAPLGLTTSADLRRPFPGFKDVYVKALVTLKHDRERGPSNDIERFEPCPAPAGAVAPPNPFAVPLTPPDAAGEGGKPQ